MKCPDCRRVIKVSDPTGVYLCVGCGREIDLNIARPVAGGRRERGRVLVVWAAVLLLVGVAVGVAVVGTRKFGAGRGTEVEAGGNEYARLAGMKSKAEELALNHRLVEAHAEYAKLLEDPAAGSKDPKVRELVGAARGDQGRIYQELISNSSSIAGADAKPATSPSDSQTDGASIAQTPSLPARGQSPDPLASPGVPREGKEKSPAAVAVSPSVRVNPYGESRRVDDMSAASRPAVVVPRPAPRAVAPAVPRVAQTVPNVAPAVAAGADDLDVRIGESMRKACDMILSCFNGGDLAPRFSSGDVRSAGLHALCVYALLQAGEALEDERLSIKGKVIPPMIDAMKWHELDGPQALQQAGAPRTYAHSLRAAALAVYDRPQDHKALQADVKWLVNAQANGGYTYDDRNAKSITSVLNLPYDNSNSQYGLLGVWAGAEAGVEVSDKYWQAVDGHWKTSQQADGQWRYTQDPTGWASLSMTCGGVASLMVTYDYLDVPKMHGVVGRDPYPGAIGMGLRWLETGDNALSTPNAHTFYPGYDLYSLERVGLASGLKFFGTHDWYRELAEKSLALQGESGAYGQYVNSDSLINTAYTLLFLARGRHPVMMEKLRFEKYWDNRPRDLANLTKYASREMERPVNWQVVSVDQPWRDWFDSPVLFIASHQTPQLTEENYANLRSFVEAGGLIFAQADGASDAFARWVPELVKKVCPNYELQQLPPTHLLYTTNYKITAPPKLMGASNGSRLLVVYSPVDLSAAWQRRERLTQRSWFELGINVFAYASGKRDMRNRVASLVVPEPAREASGKVRLARVRYSGNWDPEPYAWKRLSKKMQNDSGVAIDVQPVAAEAMASETAPLAHLTGTVKWTFTDEQCAALSAYVKGGGVLLIDSTGGQEAFAQSVEQDLLPRAFSGVTLAAMGEDHPVMEKVKLALRTYAVNLVGKAPALRIGKVGVGYVVYSPIDLNSGLLGTGTWGIVGYTPATCEQVVRNLVGWSGTVRKGL